MKKIFFLIIIIGIGALSQSVKAQFDYFGGGVTIATGGQYDFEDVTYSNKSFGFDIRASYNYNKKIKIVPDFKFYLPNKNEVFLGGGSKVTVFALNINAHYILNPKSRDNYQLYLLAGVHVGAWNIKNDSFQAFGSQLDVDELKITPGANLGGGMQFNAGNRTKIFAEIKYVISGASQLVFTPGLLYNL